MRVLSMSTACCTQHYCIKRLVVCDRLCSAVETELYRFCRHWSTAYPRLASISSSATYATVRLPAHSPRTPVQHHSPRTWSIIFNYFLNYAHQNVLRCLTIVRHQTVTVRLVIDWRQIQCLKLLLTNCGAH